ncbi:hypothetical protein MML48_4g00007077 [Holotrichia oblita]|uniref:Uncharacterized protein n=1 Tax=Holotrichia oblita TaxID=644536 RepID=A0ACB9T8R0_HOLOL|nr:hypothetical protein MML48_4g00007077 [Holotrichia oblita]
MEHRVTEGNLPEQETVEPENPDLEGEEGAEPNIPTKPLTSSNKKRKHQHRDSTTFEEGILDDIRQETNENTNFGLSLVPQLGSLSEDEKFEAKIKLLRVLKQIKRRRSMNFHSMLSPQQFTYTSTAATAIQPPSTSYIHKHTASSQIRQYNHPESHSYPIITSPANTEDTLHSYVSQFTSGSSGSEDILELS